MGAAAGAEAPFVRFTTTGATFAPVVGLAGGSGASVSWWCEETDETIAGLTPSFSFGGAGTRHVQLTATGGGGLGDIVTLNLGFDNGQDAGRYNIGAGYNKAAEAVSGIEYVNELTGLIRFLAANGNLAGTLDFTGCADLEYIECYSANVEAVTLTGCTSLIRLCLEECDLAALDLTPVVSCLYDLRSANQQSGGLALTVTGTLANLYHLCLRGADGVYTVTGIPAAAQLPVVEEVWIWNTNLTGTLTIDSPEINSVMIYNNTGLTGLVITGPIPADHLVGIGAYNCGLTSVDLTDCAGIRGIDLHDNSLDAAAVDGLLVEAESWGTSGAYTVSTTGNTSPSATGIAAAYALIGRGWTVTTDATLTGGVASDDFERADATGIGNVGNGWYAWNSATANIVSGALVRPDTSTYRQVLNPGANRPADYSVTASIPHATRTTYFGLTGRWHGTTGVRALFTGGPTDLTIGNASGWQDGNVTVNTGAGYPASWSQNQDHTVTMKMTGTLIEIFLDGQATRGFYATVTTNATLTNTAYGVCGEGQGRAWYSIGTTVP